MDLDSKLHNMTTLILTKAPQGAVAQGTGFFYSVSGQADPGGPKYQWVRTDIWVITNKHVVMPIVNGVETYPESTEGRPWGQPLKKPSGAPLNLG